MWFLIGVLEGDLWGMDWNNSTTVTQPVIDCGSSHVNTTVNYAVPANGGQHPVATVSVGNCSYCRQPVYPPAIWATCECVLHAHCVLNAGDTRDCPACKRETMLPFYGNEVVEKLQHRFKFKRKREDNLKKKVEQIRLLIDDFVILPRQRQYYEAYLNNNRNDEGKLHRLDAMLRRFKRHYDAKLKAQDELITIDELLQNSDPDHYTKQLSEP